MAKIDIDIKINEEKWKLHAPFLAVNCSYSVECITPDTQLKACLKPINSNKKRHLLLLKQMPSYK